MNQKKKHTIHYINNMSPVSKKKHTIHYINNMSPVSNRYINSLIKSKSLFYNSLSKLLFIKFPLPTMNSIRRFDTHSNSSSNIKNRISKIYFHNDYNNNINNIWKRHNFHTIFYSKNRLDHLTRNSYSVNKLVSSNHLTNFETPIKRKNSLKKLILKDNYKRQRSLTVTNTRRRHNTYTVSHSNKKKPKKELKKINLFKKLINQDKNNQIKSKKNDINEQQKKTNITNIRNRTEKNRKVARKIKIDKIEPKQVSGLESKEDRIKNLLFGRSYMTEIIECELCHKTIQRYVYKFHYFSHPTPILKWIFLGTEKNANNLEELKDLSITYILNCAHDAENKDMPDDIKYCRLNLNDSETTDITKFFPEAFSFIELARKNNAKILIHCKLGVSRSPAILIGYLIKYMGLTTEFSLDFLKAKRTQVHPNSGFIDQLYKYEKKCKINQNKNISPIKINNPDSINIK